MNDSKATYSEPRAYLMAEEFGPAHCCSDRTICEFHREHPEEIRP